MYPHVFGLRASFSQNACYLYFTGGGPYDGQKHFFDHARYDQISVGPGIKEPCYNYLPVPGKPKTFRLASINLDGKTIKIWDPEKEVVAA